MLKEYLSELLSIQCEQAYRTAQLLKATDTLSDVDRSFLARAQDVLRQTRDWFRVVKNENKEANDGKEGQV